VIDRGLFLTLQAIRRQLAAMPHDLYLLRLIHRATKRPFPGERLWTASQLTHAATVRFLRVRNREGCDVYILPYAGDRNAGYVLVDLDDADQSVIDRMRANGHDPCVVLQTSPGHLQAWIRISTSPLQPAVATAAGKQLAHAYGGDLASTDWRHLGRLAGFTNQKPQRRLPGEWAPWVKVVYAGAGVARNADALLRTVTELPLPPGPPRAGVPRNGRSKGTGTAPEDVPPPPTATQAGELYQHWMKRWHIQERFPQPDWSIVDLWVARQLWSQGMAATQIQAILRMASPHFPRRHGDPEDYLRRTVARAAFSAPGRAVCLSHARASAPAETDCACSNSTGGR
jgi:hypothetical protein